MSVHLALRADLLDGPRPPGPPDGELRSVIQQLVQRADRGECIEAAREAAELLQGGAFDVRLAGIYWVGLFIERGLSYLPELMRSATRMVVEERGLPSALRSSPRVIDSALHWVLQTLWTHIQFHAPRRDDTWMGWQRGVGPELAAELSASTDALARAIVDVVPQPASASAFARLSRWAKGDLARTLQHEAARAASADDHTSADACASEGSATATGRREEPDASPEPFADAEDEDYDGDDFGDDGDDENEEDDRNEEDEPAMRRSSLPFDESPALIALRRKLRAFELLIERGDLGKAAIVAHDVEHILDTFDPIAFLPSLFATYLRLTSQRMVELQPYLDDRGSAAWKLLARFYQADLAGFLEE